MIDSINEKIKNSHYYKFSGVAPEGFLLIPEEFLEKLKDFEFWKEWKSNPQILEEESKKICNQI